MYAALGQADPFGSLSQELERQTDPAGWFARPLAGETLKADNENFAYALFDIMPQNERAKLMAQLQVPMVQDQRLMNLLGAMLLALPANYMNVSLRQEMTRVFLAKELQEETAPSLRGVHLGSWLSEALNRVKELTGRFASSFTEVMQRLGRDIGAGLRGLGDSIHRFRDAMQKLGGPALRYVTDFLILTPGVVFLFGDLLREVGGAMEEVRRVQLLPISAGYARYLEDMALALNTMSNFLPPPWNLIAKAVAVLYKAGSMLINWQVAMHIQDLLDHQAEANAEARHAMETALRQIFTDLGPELEAAGAMEKSEHGANTPVRPEGGARFGGMLLLGFIGAAAGVVLWMGNK